MNKANDREVLDTMHKGITEGIRKAVLEHKRAGRSVSVWADGRVKKIPAKKIVIK